MTGPPADWPALLPDVARRLLGAPTRIEAGGATWRYRSRGSLAVHVGGAAPGTWHDFEADESGGTLALVQHVNGCDKAGALAWLADAGLIAPPAAADARPAAPRRAAATPVSAPIRPESARSAAAAPDSVRNPTLRRAVTAPRPLPGTWTPPKSAAPAVAPTAPVAAAILAAAVPADGTPARVYLDRRGTWPADAPDLPPAVRWLPADAWPNLPTWPGKDGRPARLAPPPLCGAVVYELARPGAAPDAVTLEAVTAAGARPAERWRRSPGGTTGRTFTVPAPSGDGWPETGAAPLVVAVVEGEADALALARLRLPGVLVRAIGGTGGKGRPGALVADLPATVAVVLVSDGDRAGRAAVVELHEALHGAGRTCYAAVLAGGDPDELLRGADDAALAELHAERAAILEHDGGLDRPAATARALARLLETLPRRRTCATN